MSIRTLACCLLIAGCAAVEPAPVAPPAAAPAPRVALAVLPCEAGSPDLLDIARAIPELLGAGLSRVKTLELVERERLDRALAEQSLGATGLVDPELASRIGRLAGAKLLVLPRTYAVGDQLFLSAKVVNAETGRVHTVAKSGARKQPNLTLLTNLLVDDIAKAAAGDLQRATASDDERLDALVAEIDKALAGKPRPVVTVVVPEEHLRRSIPDPAVKTQLSYLLRKLRFKVIENDSPLLDQWVKDQFAGKAVNFPAEVGNVEVVIYGGAFSETVGQTGNLVSARGRLELSAIKVATGEVLAVQAKTGAAADLSESVAGKTALEKATLAAAKPFLIDLVNAAAPAKP